MNIDKKALGQRIKSIRQDKGLTMEEFGKFFDNASKGVISNWEKGSNIPNNTRLKMIAQFGGRAIYSLHELVILFKNLFFSWVLII